MPKKSIRKHDLSQYFPFCNYQRPHQALGYRTRRHVLSRGGKGAHAYVGLNWLSM